jgi:hypothetical protein
VNRGNPSWDSDQFNAAFGGNATAARTVVDAVLAAWQNVIQNFNYANGSNTLSLTISVNLSSWGNGALAYAGTQTDGHGKPTAGRIVIDAGTDGHGGGWYFDATPNSPAFAGNLVNAYAREGTPGMPSSYLGDLFTVIGHEVLHTLGLSFSPTIAMRYSPYVRNTGQPDVVDRPGTLFTFTGPDVQALLTSDDGDSTDFGAAEHTTRVGNYYTDPVTRITYNGIVDVLNPIYLYGRRMLPSLMDALILKDVYGYTISPPPSFWGTVTPRSIVTGSAPGGAPVVSFYDAVTGAFQFSFYAYNPGYTSGVRAVLVDWYGRGVPQVLTAPGPGAPPLIRLFDGANGQLLLEFMAYDPSFLGGINIALGDINGDGIPDLVAGAATGAPDVRVFNGRAFATHSFNPNNPSASWLAQWFAYDLSFHVGVNVAVGDINHDGYADIVTGATTGNPHVKIYNGRDIATGAFNRNNPDASLIAQWFAYPLQFNVGVNVTVGDIERDGYADVITGATTGNPHIKVYSGQAISAGGMWNSDSNACVIAQWFAYGLQYNVGTFLAVADLDGSGYADIITGASVGNPHVKIYNGRGIATGLFNPNNPDADLLDQFFAGPMGIGVTVGARS